MLGGKLMKEYKGKVFVVRRKKEKEMERERERERKRKLAFVYLFACKRPCCWICHDIGYKLSNDIRVIQSKTPNASR